MTMIAIEEEINKLPLREKLLLIEKTLKSIKQERKNALKSAVHVLHDEYVANTELTSFTSLDTQTFPSSLNLPTGRGVSPRPSYLSASR